MNPVPLSPPAKGGGDQGDSGSSLANRAVLHRCDTPACVNPAHLFLGTNDDNMADMVAKGRAMNPGSPSAAHPRARLSDADVAAIRSGYVPRGPGCTTAALAARFGIGKRHIRAIASGQRWRPS